MTLLTKTPVLLIALCFTACLGGRFQPYSKADEPLFAALRELNRHPENIQVQKGLPVLYQQAVERHTRKIYALNFANHYGRFDGIAYEEEALKHINDAIRSVPAAFAIIKPKEILNLMGANDYYRSEIDTYWWNMAQSKPEDCNTNY